MPIPLKQAITVGFYLFKQKLKGNKKYPLVLMLEPLFRCNLECLGCGKIQKPHEILRKNLSPKECFRAAEDCEAPIVSIAGGEPLMHPDIIEIVQGLVKRGRYVYLCTNALLLDSFFDQLPKSPLLTLSVHLDGNEAEHDRIVDRPGTYKKVVEAIRKAKSLGFRVTCNTTIFDNVSIKDAEGFFDSLKPLSLDGITVSSGFQYEDAPDQKHFMGRKKTFEYFDQLLSLNKKGRWDFNHSPLYLDFLRGKRNYNCTPWGNPNYSVLGWQKPCYLLDEGYAETFQELLETTPWEKYGHINNPKCADCTAHCGYEPSAVNDASSSMKSMLVSLKAVFQ